MTKPEAGALGGRRPGRPPRAPESVRQNRVVTLVTDAEFKKLAKLAGEEEKSMSAMVHKIITRYLKRRG